MFGESKFSLWKTADTDLKWGKVGKNSELLDLNFKDENYLLIIKTQTQLCLFLHAYTYVYIHVMHVHLCAFHS